jgi:8-oxo-dGTP pyrophosphatase MutT (NUDIX family)
VKESAAFKDAAAAAYVVLPNNRVCKPVPTGGVFMARLDFAQKAVVIDGDRVLLVRKSKDDPHNPGKWDLPGGRMKGSEDVDAHLVREVLEETGLTVSPGRPINLWSWEMSWNGEEVRVIAVSRYCDLTSSPVQASRREEDDYLSEQQWVSRKELLSFDIIPSQLPTINLVAQDDACHPM